MAQVGVWFIGAHGGVATTAVVGALAMRRGLCPPWGMVTELENFRLLRLAPLSEMAFGGHEIRPGSFAQAARQISEQAGTLRPDWIARLEPELEEIDRRVRPGTVYRCGEAIEALAASPRPGAPKHPREIVDQVFRDLAEFRAATGVRSVVVVNLSSTEPPIPAGAGGPVSSLDRLEAELASPAPQVPASVLYAYAALKAGCAYVNFTPSAGSSVPALQEYALRRELPHMGQDGKTGETLVKTVLAPMFVARNLRVLSWEGHNLLGDRDGQILSHPENAQGKLKNKDETLRAILGDPELHSRVRIDYVPSLDDWKTAWDFIHFQGFLGVKMSMQFTWQGCDSILAAPLVLDLARLAELAHRNGEKGLMPHLACFFKSPTGVGEHNFHKQFESLLAYVEAHRARAVSSAIDARAGKR